jgi:2-keto-3-deoxy-L-rhamnonate aldolase RhmA
MHASVSGAEFKKQLRGGAPKLGLFLNSHSPTVAEQLSHSGYDWLLVDTQHGPMGNESLSGMLAGIANGGATSIVRPNSLRRDSGSSASATICITSSRRPART